MKKTLLWSICLLIANVFYAQQFDYQSIKNNHEATIEFRNGEIFIADSVLCFQYDETSADVVPQLREYALATNDQGEVTEKLVEMWSTATNSYRDKQLFLRSFSGQNRLVEEITKVANNGAANFTNHSRIRFTRNAANNPTEVIREEWAGSWILKSRELYEYQNGIRPTLFTFQTYENGNWVNNFRAFTNYNTGGKIASTLFQTWTDNNWLNGNRTFLSYNDDGQLILTNREIWDASITDWQLSSREIHVYQFGQNTETRDELYQDFDESWTPLSRKLKFYDDAGNLFQVTSQNYLNEDWVNVFKQISIYDENTNLSRSVGELWINQAWRTQNSCDFFYSLFVTNIRDLFEEQVTCKFANPMVTGSTFNCNGLSDMHDVSLRIFNLQGQQVHHQNIKNSDYFNINTKLPFGLYQVVLQTAQGIVFSKKVLVD